jgi:hypothetical protein
MYIGPDQAIYPGRLKGLAKLGFAGKYYYRGSCHLLFLDIGKVCKLGLHIVLFNSVNLNYIDV